MAWVQLDSGGAAPLLGVRKTGIIEWNAAAHAMMGNSIAVEMFHDAEAGRLGFRGVDWLSPLRVRFNEDMRYCIDAAGHLENAGLSFNKGWTAEPQPPDVLDPPDPPDAPDYRRIVWVEIPD